MNNKIDYKTKLLKNLNNLFTLFFWVMDFNELDLEKFLKFKDYMKYSRYVLIRNGLFVSILISLVFSSIITEFFVDIILVFVLYTLFIIFDGYFYSKFKYNKMIYRRKKKLLNNFRKELTLLYNNWILYEILDEKSNRDEYDVKYNQIIEKIENFRKTFRSYEEVFKQFGIIAIITLILGFIINSLVQFAQIPINVDWNIFLDLGLMVSFFFVFYRLMNSRLFRKYYSERPKILFAEQIIVGFFAMVSLNLELLEDKKYIDIIKKFGDIKELKDIQKREK